LEFKSHINKWFIMENRVGYEGAGLSFDMPMDDIIAIDRRMIKTFVLRTIQCLASCGKWEKLAEISMRFNALTGYEKKKDEKLIIFCSQFFLILFFFFLLAISLLNK
jgi:hypothetical protein